MARKAAFWRDYRGCHGGAIHYWRSSTSRRRWVLDWRAAGLINRADIAAVIRRQRPEVFWLIPSSGSCSGGVHTFSEAGVGL
jgi:hypothetical protein